MFSRGFITTTGLTLKNIRMLVYYKVHPLRRRKFIFIFAEEGGGVEG